ncbi:Flp family type IVb pilin [Consotaella salsifontis]|uniref:Pilus assembly protein Flp/PilA n=1 Tax=Consotaella salsifontis TaxID=1365950 RepID=A0A1T4TBS7_9HYPH|nr:Flp family type IVb pilin [Consotaella salsifontis]SKA37669.1 pilus assembly protein Flp/PilA [Consotaella salsifontis]
MKTLKRCIHDKTGATALEYGLIAGIMALAVVSAFTPLTGTLGSSIEAVGDRLVSSGSHD